MKTFRTTAVALFLLLVCGSANAQNKSNRIMYELPAFSREPFYYSAYTVLFNTDTNIPDWVAWRLDKNRLGNVNVSRNGDHFQRDPNLGSLSPVSSDYVNTGFDRGHMCPAKDCLQSGEALLESFYMSNVCPQKRSLNGKSWSTLEDKCRTWINDNFYESLYIVCGPVPDEIEKVIVTPKRHIVVPKRFFKAIIGERKHGGYVGLGFIFDQRGHATAMSIDNVEAIVHMDLFANFPGRISRKVESKQPNSNDWPHMEVIGLNT